MGKERLGKPYPAKTDEFSEKFPYQFFLLQTFLHIEAAVDYKKTQMSTSLTKSTTFVIKTREGGGSKAV